MSGMFFSSGSGVDGCRGLHMDPIVFFYTIIYYHMFITLDCNQCYKILLLFFCNLTFNGLYFHGHFNAIDVKMQRKETSPLILFSGSVLPGVGNAVSFSP